MTNKMISPFRTSFGVAFLAALIALSPILVTAQDSYGVAAARVANGTGFLRGFSAVSTESLILLRYTGTSALGGTITVAAGGDLTFSQGAVGSSAVDATMECDAAIAASGSRNGIYDLSTPDVACDTLGEVVDLINSQGTNWRAVILDGARANLTDNMFITLSESAGVNSIDGLGLLNDGTTSFSQSIAVVSDEARKMKFYIPGTQRTDRVFRTNPFENTTRILYSMTANSTYASGTSLHTLSCVAVTNRQGTSTVSAETVTTYSKAAGATTVEATWAPSTYGVSCPRGQKMLARTVNSAAMSAATLYVAGHIF